MEDGFRLIRDGRAGYSHLALWAFHGPCDFDGNEAARDLAGPGGLRFFGRRPIPPSVNEP
jgi:hypothetical protein